jgi:uncharacterized repeat protein (TIGR03803 family)
MRSKKPFSAGKPTFVIFMALLLASAIVPTQAQARKFKVLHTFHGANGAEPVGQLTRDGAGNFYGTTAAGGRGVCNIGNSQPGCGTAFKLDKTGRQVWLHSFNGADGWEPLAGLLRDRAGNLYGTTMLGGDEKCFPPYGCGAVFKLDKNGKETVLHKFSGTPDGEMPEALLVEDEAGNLYGTAYMGGTEDDGVVFEIDTTGHERVLYSFCSQANCADGSGPGPGVIRDAAGNLYGVTGAGGANGTGAVFELDAQGVETVLYSFTDGADGGGPASVLRADAAGNLYGTTAGGGSYQGECAGQGCGVVFELSPHSGGNWTETTLYRFNGTDGQRPESGPIVRDSAGTLFGTTYFGGNSSGCNGTCGVVFRLDKSGTEFVLYDFTGGTDGAVPWAGMILGKAGNLYGTTELGGDSKCPLTSGQGCGVIFMLTH